MNRGLKISILIVVGIAVVVAIVVVARKSGVRRAGESVEKTTSAPQPTNVSTAKLPAVQPPTEPAPPLTAEEQTALSLQQVAATFAERYGSYSNQSNFQNLRDVMPLVTDSFRRTLEARIAAGTSASGEYNGVTTRALQSSVAVRGSGSAEVAVKTQRETTVGTSEPTTSYETLTLTFELVGQTWKVDAAVWKPTSS